MHIPDGYLSPATCAAGYAVALPALAVAVRKVKAVVTTRRVPTLAMFSSVSFLVMMFNIPIPDGTTAHAVGAGVIAIVLGPWAAMIAVAVALLFQALLFGDGGVLAYGANVVNMAVAMPFVAYGLSKLISGRSEITSTRRVLGAAVGGYAGITVAALLTGIELGIQPALFHDAAGTPLYSPYHLSQTIPAMLLAHLLVAGFAEAALSGGVVAYLQRANPPLLRANEPDSKRPAVVAWVAIGLLVVATPLGLLASGEAFGEDAPESARVWTNILFDGYSFGGPPWLAYVVCAVVGVFVVGMTVFLIGRVRTRR